MSIRDYAQRVLVTLLLAGLAWMVYRLSGVLLYLFGAILFAVVLNELAAKLCQYTGMPAKWAMVVTVLVTVGVLVSLGHLFGSQVVEQLNDVMEMLPQGLESISDRLGLSLTVGDLRSKIDANSVSEVLKRVSTYGVSFVSVLSNLLLVGVASIFLAVNPDVYQRGFLLILPPGWRQRVQETFRAVAQALRRWFVGQVVAMLAVGWMSALAYWWIGLPSAMVLAVIAGVTNFIPMLGPILGGLVALALAATVSLDAMMWTALAVLVIQQIESNLLMPFIQEHAVNVPPAVIIFSLLGMGVLFGIGGMVLAVPLSIALMVAIQKLWVNDALGGNLPLAGSGSESESR